MNYIRLVLIYWSCILLFGCSRSTTTFFAFGDIPYSNDDVEKLKKGIDYINNDGEHTFSIHLGDIKPGKSPCSNAHNVMVANILKKSKNPIFIIPGDNEINDCPEPIPQDYNWGSAFQNFENNWNTTKAIYSEAYQENFAFVDNKSLFVGLHLVAGKRINKVEWDQRLKANLEWLKMHINAQQFETLIILGHSDIQLAPSDNNYFFFTELKNIAEKLEQPVLYLHGDGHNYEVTEFLTSNMIRCEVNSGSKSDWLLKITVNHKNKEVFKIERIDENEAIVIKGE